MDDRKLLIIHADDYGMCHSVNLATRLALESRSITSASVMAPCAWLPEAVSAREHHDIGIHLTLTSECSLHKWRPLTLDASLSDLHGYMLEELSDATDTCNAMRRELCEQISLVRRLGLEPTHLDSHQFSLLKKGRVSLMTELSRCFNIPCLLPRFRNGRVWNYDSPRYTIDNVIYADSSVLADDWTAFYVNAINELTPGIHQLIVHLGFDTDELRAVMGADAPWGSRWRQRDFDAITGNDFRNALRLNDIELTDWRSIAEFRRDVCS